LWDLLEQDDFVNLLFHVNGHGSILRKVKPTTVEQLAAVFGQQQGGGSVRPPRDTEVPAHHPRLAELTALCDTFHFADFAELSLGELDALVVALEAFEMVQSTDRKSLFGQIDALSAELVARYKNGGANINSLLE
jgi:hypothetical protein